MSDSKPKKALNWTDDIEGRALSLVERRQAFGQILKAAREGQKVSIVSLAQGTRISANFIEALESGQFERLPGEIFGRGFLRNLSRALELPAATLEQLLVIYNDCCVDEEMPVAKKTKRKPTFVPAKSEPVTLLNKAEMAQASSPAADVSSQLQPSIRVRLGRSAKKPLPRWFWGLSAAALVAVALVGLQQAGIGLKAKHQAESLKKPQPPVVVESVAVQKPEPIAIDPGAMENGELNTSESAALQNTGDKVETPATIGEPSKPQTFAVNTLPGSIVGAQTLELVVTEPVKIRLGLDEEAASVKEFKPDTYRFTFKNKAELLVFDAGSVLINYNGKSLGPLGTKGRVRRLSFDTAPPNAKKF